MAKDRFTHSGEHSSVGPLKQGEAGRRKKRKYVITRHHNLGIGGFLAMKPLMRIMREFKGTTSNADWGSDLIVIRHEAAKWA